MANLTTWENERRELELLRRWRESQPQFKPQKTNLPQNQAFNCDADEIGYGGAAGGGKTFLGFMMAMYKHWHSVVFRRNLDQHGALLEIIRAFDQKHLAGYPPIYRPERTRKVEAKKIQFAHLDHESDLEKHQGKAKDFLWFDEAVHFNRYEISRLAAHLRPLQPEEFAKTPLKCQLLLTFNPPLDAKGLWVLQMFGPWINYEHPRYPTPFGKVLYCAYWNGQDYFYDTPDPITHDPATGDLLRVPINLKSRTFFKAYLSDNEALRDNDAYIAQLQSMSEVERKAFLDGEMTASLVDAAGQIFKRANYLRAVERWRNTPAPTTPPLCISIDVTGGGDDLFVMIPFWRGGYAGMPKAEKGANVPSAYDQCNLLEAYIMDELHGVCDMIDIVYDSGGGYGNAFADEWRRRYPNASLTAFQGGSAAGVNEIFGATGADLTPLPISGMPKISGLNGFDNKISAAWVRAGQMLEHPAFTGVCIPPHDELMRQATMRRIKERANRRIAIEPKSDPDNPTGYVKRLGCSPDFADAFVMGLHYLSVYVAGAEYWKRK